MVPGLPVLLRSLKRLLQALQMTAPLTSLTVWRLMPDSDLRVLLHGLKRILQIQVLHVSAPLTSLMQLDEPIDRGSFASYPTTWACSRLSVWSDSRPGQS